MMNIFDFNRVIKNDMKNSQLLHAIYNIKYFLFMLFFANVFFANANDEDGPCDEGNPNAKYYYYDNDNDGYGTERSGFKLCEPSGFYRALVGGDCDDENELVINRTQNWYVDKDKDGKGDFFSAPLSNCEQPQVPGGHTYVPNNEDCNDADINVYQKSLWYVDKDNDGKGDVNATPVRSCTEPQIPGGSYGYVTNNEDCLDNDPDRYLITWYRDEDGDGFGENVYSIKRCTKPFGNYYQSNSDVCPGVFGENNGCPAADAPELINTLTVTNYDIKNKTIGKTRSYFDDLGKPLQTQTKDFKTGKIWATQTMYDAQGRPALQTLGAPTNSDIPLDFLYRNNLVKKSDGSNFTAADFENDPENPLTVGTQVNSLGWYYSTQNTDEPYQDVTSRPYSRTIYSELNPGTALRTLGGNKIDGQWKNGYVFSMPAGGELVAATGDAKYNTYKIIKTVSRDVHGIENVVFTDTDGNTLASARSGNEEGDKPIRYSVVSIGAQGYVDIHIPTGASGIELINNTGINTDFYNLITEQKRGIPGSLPAGFYRISVRDLSGYVANTIQVRYPENYYDYSLNEYDKAGRLLTSKQPLKDSSGTQLTSTFDYNSFGQLETTVSPDEGQAWFRYRKDGQIRFSQNIKEQEHSPQEFSYTNYDKRGRPIESGVIESTAFTTADVDGDLPSGNKKEVHHTTYDRLANDDTFLNTLATTYQKPSFLAGNVAKTKNENTTTYYSYDIYGRVQWIVQQIAGLSDAKTIDYEYDPVSSQVTKVYFQKGHATEQFIHRYTYDAADYSLVKVETSTDDTTYTEHANYEYNETGGLKRIDIAQGLQGIDYVYNLQGALKSINHPSLQSANDPGGDTNDLFGMMIDYNEHDYNRPLKNIKSASYGANQYNGNIKGIRWNSDYNPIAGKEHTYRYDYNRNNWLTQATYGNFTPDNSSIPVIIDEETAETPVANDHISSVKSVLNAGQTQHLQANKSITMVPGFHAKPGSSFSATIVGGTSDYIRDINAGTFAVNANGDYKVDNITYDANGNIKSLYRNKQTESGSNVMDQLSYTYKEGKPNQLLRVDDAAGDVSGADDIGDQEGNNYKYNVIGQLIEDWENVTPEERANYIATGVVPASIIRYTYNASGLVTMVSKKDVPLVKFFYNDKGHRVRKEAYTPSNGNLNYTEHYVRDASGTAMAIYRDGQVIENTIYGASRLGVRKSDGNHLYQLTDHLGNVRAVVGRNAQGQAMAMTSATDYYPFGMPMPGRNQVGDYRYAFQGQEKDPETGKEAFELRLWDARIGRWLTTDPKGEFSSPYLGMGNNPIRKIDPDGGSTDDWFYDLDGNLRYDDNVHNQADVDRIYGNGDMLSGGVWKTSEAFKEGNLIYHSFGLVSNLETGEFDRSYLTDEFVIGNNFRSDIAGYDFEKAVKHLNENYRSKPCGYCAKFVRQALEAGGLSTNGRPRSAKGYDSFLPKLGFREIPSENYVPMAGDLIVMQSFKYKNKHHKHGHLQMFNGKDWVSDFKQRDFWPGNSYRKAQPKFKIFR